MPSVMLDRPNGAGLAIATAEEVAAAWLLGYSGATREAYARELRAWSARLSGFGAEPLEVRRAHVDADARALEVEGRAPATVARALAGLSSFYGYAVAEGLISHDPLAAVRRPRVEAPQTLGLSGAEVSRLLGVAEVAGQREHALLCLLALNGLRVSEVLGVDVGDLGSERGHRTLSLTRKGGSTNSHCTSHRSTRV